MGVERRECGEQKGQAEKRITTRSAIQKNLPCRRSLSTQDRKKKKACGARWPLQGRMIEHVPLRCSLFTSTIKVQWRDSTHIWLNVVKCSHPFPLPLESLLDTFKHLVSHCLPPSPAYVLSQLYFIVFILLYFVHLFQTSLDFFFGMFFFFFCNCSLFVLCLHLSVFCF